MKDIKSVIFDLDGTLVDSMMIWGNIAMDYLKSHGATPKSTIREDLRSTNSIEEAQHYKDVYGVDLPVDVIVTERNNMMLERYKNDVRLKQGVKETLEALKKRGVRICLATATERNLAKPAIEAQGIAEYFERIFTCAEENTSKKYPDLYNIAAEFLGTKPHETLVVEDALYASKTAKNAGFVVAGVYDEVAADNQDELKSICDYYFVNMDEMLELL